MTLWGGRFSQAPSAALWDYTVDFADRRLLEVDVEGSLAHVAMLARAGLLTSQEQQEIETGLKQIRADARDKSFEFLPGDEDVHSAVERRLVELVGEIGQKLHTGRSRNDQMALDLRLYLRRATADRISDLDTFVSVLVDRAEEHAETVVPAYTHLQQAQAVSLGHHLLAYAWMARRDQDRLRDLGRRLQVSPLGAGAVAGSSLPLDPAYTAELLGFESAFSNSIDAVSSRDLVAEFAFCVAQAMVHLSRFAEDLILWSTSEFGWVTFSDDYTTGSSALPQKKNPDVAELARGRSAGAIGELTTLLVMQKGLPLAYNRDLQEDKPPLFRADGSLEATLNVLGGMLATASFHPPLPNDWTVALDLAEALVGKGVASRQAHAAVGRLVASLLGADRNLADATIGDLQQADHRFDESDLELLVPAHSLRHRVTAGGGSADDVRRQVEALRA
ncbi:MAG TPA: argininosuccinate lyase, partial [Acidimicrobiia bacterium]|nr:argininosuccinate lyase [Acidimicrobiia bacterium]